MNLDRNIVIEASAGTGKTYTLVQTILQALFQKNLPMEALVALTFTKKAAGEMKERIAAELQKIDLAEKMEDNWRAWGQPLDELKERARYGLETIDRAAIGTIHSYAFTLLKRFPLEAGISPEAEVDEKGVRADDLFEQAWPTWLRYQLSTQDSELKTQKEWLEVLERIPLSQIRLLTRRLCDFDIPLDCLPLSDNNLTQALEPFYNSVRDWASSRKPDLKSTRIAAACEETLGIARNEAWDKLAELSDESRSALEEMPSGAKEWPDEDVRQLKLIRGLALNMIARGDRTLSLLTGLIKPFVSMFRGRLLAEGYLSNNALLVLARDLVAKNFEVRQTLKHYIRLIFIDEFQDTDPIQGELLIFLAEQRATRAKNWEDVVLESGKLFIVGDPKQSIYLFRGADTSAYNKITQMVLSQGGMQQPLAESYRSHDQIIHAVNAAFGTLIQENPPISPAYQALVPRRTAEDPDRHLVELRLAASQEEQTSDQALEKEAADVADWILTARAANRWAYKDIGLIFRSRHAMPPFVEKLRAANVPFIVEAESYFFHTQEVVDVLNLLRTLDDPNNRIALAGFLRSPLGGFNDAELALLQAKNGLRLSKPLPPELDAPAHRGAWELLRKLRWRVGREPLKNILHRVYEDTYLLELAARSYHRDQTIANLLKLKRLMESFAEEGETSLRGLLAKIDRFMEDDRLEGESPLADDTYDAVRLLTIHKAKGLEFPVVWLPGLHRGAGGDRDTNKVTARYDWGSERVGIAIGRLARNMDDFVLETEIRAREEAEEARVLYVAMTRAKDHLILSGGVCKAGRSRQPAKGSFLDQIATAWGLSLLDLPEGKTQVGETVITVRRSPKPSAPAPIAGDQIPEWLRTLDAGKVAKIWKERERVREQLEATVRKVTPSSTSTELRVISNEQRAMREEGNTSLIAHRSPLFTGNSSSTLGSLVHRFLEQWDFSCEKCSMPAKLRIVANHYLASQGLLKEPFPDPKETNKTNNPPELIAIVEEAQNLLADFIGSEAWEEIKNSKTIGREVPFFYSTPEGAIMRGFMDILYRTPEGQLIIGDYKTDKEPDDQRYSAQAAAYTEAVSRALGEKATFQTIYLRAPTRTS